MPISSWAKLFTQGLRSIRVARIQRQERSSLNIGAFQDIWVNRITIASVSWPRERMNDEHISETWARNNGWYMVLVQCTKLQDEQSADTLVLVGAFRIDHQWHFHRGSGNHGATVGNSYSTTWNLRRMNLARVFCHGKLLELVFVATKAVAQTAQSIKLTFLSLSS